jgi:tRNA(fMet)-specific endonuclease VapC
MAIILYADLIIWGEKGTFDLKSWVASRPSHQFEMAAIAVSELWLGVERATGTHKVARQRYLDALLESLPIISYYTEQTAYEHARLWAELEVSKKMIGFYDLIVGATALERGREVAAFKKRHFGQISGLSVIEEK